MTGNPLIFEYFEGKYPENIEEIICKMRNKTSNNMTPEYRINTEKESRNILISLMTYRT